MIDNTNSGPAGVRVVHRYLERGWYTPKNATALLLGTFPSVLIREAFGRVRQSDVDFFYGSADNNFWKDLGAIYNIPFSFERTEAAVQQRMQLLDKLGLALSDAIFACTTSGSAMDTALQNIELNKGIITTLDAMPAINKLYFTSSSGKVNAETLTLRLLKEEGRSSSMRIVQQSGPRRRQFIFTDAMGRQRLINTVTLISPSPLAEQMAGIKPEQRRALYGQWLPEVSQK
jgi:G:T/U-mismatch repair DNA glycosylase